MAISLFPKPLIFVVISVLVVALVYSSISAFNVFAAPNAAPSNAECKELSTSNAIQGFFTYTKCCWTETDPNDPEGIELYYCQSCYKNGVCDPKHPASQGPTSPPTGPAAPLQEGVLEQLEQPPLFGRNEAAVPPTGGIVQPFTSTTPPLFGNVPLQGGFGILQEPETPPTFGQVAPLVQKPTTETPPTPLPTPPPPDFTPQDNQDDNQGGGLPTIENQENVPPGGGVAEQPQDDEEQEDTSEGAETAGPLT